MKTFLLFILLSTPILSHEKVKIGAVQFDKYISTSSETLTLNGAGIRNLWFLDLFAVGLYVKSPTTDGKQIIASDSIQALRIVIISHLVTLEKFKDGIEAILRKMLKDDFALITDDLELFKSFLGGEMKPGSEIYAVYDRKKGLKIFRDGKYNGVIPGSTFKKEALRLWVGEICVSEDLRDDLLGI